MFTPETVIRRPRLTLAEARSAYSLLAPVILFFLVFQYYPILKSIGISFMEYGLLNRHTPFVGLENYVRQFQDPLLLAALSNTVVFVAAAVLGRRRDGT